MTHRQPQWYFAAFLTLALLALSGDGLATQSPRQLFDNAVADFAAGRFDDAAAGFDRVAELVPDQAPYLWQRGIALYYAARWQDCREQFESHRTVNPADVENAAWHFLCIAREQGPERARELLLPVGDDGRVPMDQIYLMFRGEATPDRVLAAAGDAPRGQFYAYLYVGLYQEALGNAAAAREAIELAAEERFAGPGNYMHMVARAHLLSLEGSATPRY